MKKQFLHSLCFGPYNRASSTFILLWARIEGVLLVSLIVVYINGFFGPSSAIAANYTIYMYRCKFVVRFTLFVGIYVVYLHSVINLIHIKS
jgi:hypothetical protein